MPQFRHLFPTGTAATERYTYPKDVRGAEFKVPPRDDRPTHGGQLIREVETAAQQAQDVAIQKPAEQQPKGFVLHFVSDPGFNRCDFGIGLNRSRFFQVTRPMSLTFTAM